MGISPNEQTEQQAFQGIWTLYQGQYVNKMFSVYLNVKCTDLLSKSKMSENTAGESGLSMEDVVKKCVEVVTGIFRLKIIQS